MTEPAPGLDEPYPDVSVGKRAAIIVTTASAVIYAAAFIYFAVDTKGAGLVLLASLILAATLLILSYVDLRTGLLLDVLTLPLILMGIGWAAFAPVGTGAGLMNSVLGAIIGYGLIAGLAYAWRRFRGYEGIGLGDAKLLAAGGAWVGATALPLILFVASISGLLAALIVSQKSSKPGQRVALPFGPCLALGIWIVWCLMDTVLIKYSALG